MPRLPELTLETAPAATTLYPGQEEQAPEIWAEQYVDVWLLEVTAEAEAREPIQAKLIATTTDPMTAAFQQLWRTYAERSILTLFLHSRYSEPQPYVDVRTQAQRSALI